MDQKQLQIARTVLWHQTAPLLTGEEAGTWLEDLGFCLFLPRHAQLPAPAPSFVEAVHGAASAAPPTSTLAHANELTARLVEERRIVPLNLLGTYSEQPDFLVTPEVLPWVAAVRGDRQWNAAPGGRTAPLVVRTWQVLDREGEATAVELREMLGRELTEAAVLRALIELWTTVRAMPVALAAAGPAEATRWTLLKHRFPAQLGTGANTALPMALSALLSIYLRSAVAATAEEAEIFLSPLTARSRIREVIHGMTAARQFGSMSVGSHTLLFVAGSLPEDQAIEEAKPDAPAAAPIQARAERARPFRKEFQERRGSSRPAERSGRGPRPPFQERRPEKRGGTKPWQQRGFRGPERPVRAERPSAESRSGAREEKRPGAARPWDRNEKRPGRREGTGAKPWQRRGSRGPERPVRAERPSAESRPEAREEKRPGAARPWDRDEKRPGRREESGAKPWQRRRNDGESRERPARFNREGEKRRSGFKSEPRGEEKPGRKLGWKSGPKPAWKSGQKSGFRPGRKRPGEKTQGPKSFGGRRGEFPRPDEGRTGSGGTRGTSGDRRPRFGKPRDRESTGRSPGRGKTFKPGARKNFRKANPGEQNPRKNRSQEENPE